MSFRPRIRRETLSMACVLVALTSSTVHGAAGSECTDYSNYLRWTGESSSPGQAFGVAVSGSHAYVVSGDLSVLNISDSVSPEVLATLEIPNVAWCVAVSEDLAYVGASTAYGNEGTLHVVDISNPSHPVELGNVRTQGAANDVAVSGKHAYVVDNYFGLQVVDISDPTSPAIVGNVNPPGAENAVAVSGNLAYVATHGLTVVDISDPTFPQIIGTVATPDRPRDVAVLGHHVYLADPANGLIVVDVSNPASPMVVGALPPPRKAFSVAVSGAHVYLGTEVGSMHKGRFEIVDVSSPASPIVVGGLGLRLRGASMAISAGHAYVGTNGSGLQVLDVSRPASAPVLGSIDTPEAATSPHVLGSHAYIVSGSSGLLVADVSSPDSPSLVGSAVIPDYAIDVAVREDYAYVTGRDVGGARLHVVDVSDPASPVIVGSTVSTQVLYPEVAISGSYAYVAGVIFQVVDVSNPASPIVVGSANIPKATSVAAAGSYAFITHHTNSGIPAELVALDASNPATPSIVGRVDIPGGRAGGLALSGGRAYVTGQAELHVVDVSSPSSPEIVGSVATPAGNGGGRVSVLGNFAYVVAGEMIMVVDVSNPRSPRVIGSMDGARDVFACDGYVYLASTSGLRILAAQCDGPVPVLLSGFAAQVQDQAVLLSWFTSFESAHDGFHVYRSGQLASGYSRLNERLLRGRSPYSYLDSAVLPAATYYYKLGAIDTRGHEVLHPPTSATTPPLLSFRTALAPGSPNPFRRETTLTFTLAARQDATLAIYDVTGRLVRQVVQGGLPEGEHVATWDGRDDAGLRVAGGTYFVRFNAGDESRSEKVVYLGE